MSDFEDTCKKAEDYAQLHYEEALKRVKDYGEHYQMYSSRSSLLQAISVFAALQIFIASHYKLGIFSCMMYMVIAVYQYAVGVKIYSDLFDLCTTRLRAGFYTQEWINSDGANRPIEIIYFIKFLAWVSVMTTTFYALFYL